MTRGVCTQVKCCRSPVILLFIIGLLLNVPFERRASNTSILVFNLYVQIFFSSAKNFPPAGG